MGTCRSGGKFLIQLSHRMSLFKLKVLNHKTKVIIRLAKFCDALNSENFHGNRQGFLGVSQDYHKDNLTE